MPSKPPRRIEPKFTPYQPDEPVPYWQRASNFIRASAVHVLNGFPKASLDVVKIRFDICTACHLYEPRNEESGVCKHSKCGCNVKNVGISGINKLTWADQACPLGKWDATERTLPNIENDDGTQANSPEIPAIPEISQKFPTTA